MSNRLLSRFLVFVLVSLTYSPSFADDAADAAKAAREILISLQNRKYDDVWNNLTSQFFKGAVSKDSFLANMTLVRQQLGPTQSPSRIVDVSYTKQDPSTMIQGEIYAINFASSYAAGRFFERIVVIKEPDGAFRLSGIWGAPAGN